MPEGGTAQEVPKGALPKLVGRTSIFAYDLILLVVLVIVGTLYLKYPQPSAFLEKAPRLAIEAMWFGSLGGIIISLKGIYDHSEGPDGWDPSFNLWHIGRPISGAIAGLITLVLLDAIDGSNAPASTVLYAAAFIFGTQERRFFNFLYEVARLIVQVPEDTTASGLRITEIQPPTGFPGDVIVITGQGMGPHTIIKLGTVAIGKLAVSEAGTSAAGLIPAAPVPGPRTVDVTASDDSGASFVVPAGFTFSTAKTDRGGDPAEPDGSGTSDPPGK
jgi:hypothetical protein